MADSCENETGHSFQGTPSQNQKWQAQVLCRFHLAGSCREGSNCRFSHDVNHGVVPKIPVCRYFTIGQCVYGDLCRYQHILPGDEGVDNEESNVATSPSHPELSSSPSSQLPLPSTSNITSTPKVTPASSVTPAPVTSNTSVSSKDGDVIQPDDRVVWMSDDGAEHGTVKWVGYLDEVVKRGRHSNKQKRSPENLTVGVEFDNPVGSGTGMYKDRVLFRTKMNHASLIPIMGLIKENEFMLPSSTQEVGLEAGCSTNDSDVGAEDPKDLLCPYNIMGMCRYNQSCMFTHGNMCDMCNKPILHPTNNEQRKSHELECMNEHEKDMELSFAIARSKDLTCGICMEVVMDKKPMSEARFGILSNCNHVFCLACIRKWRNSKQFENKIVRSCPECRISSNFVTPSKHWFEEKEDKEQLIEGYKSVLGTKPCKYFDEGRGECPFGGNCFYLHQYPDGKKAVLPPPRTRRRQGHLGRVENMRDVVLWEFLEDRGEYDMIINLSSTDADDLEEQINIILNLNLLSQPSDSDTD